VILNVVNNQWAISTFQAIAGGEGTTFAARGVGSASPRCGSTATTSWPSTPPRCGRRARAPQPRADADRVGDLPRRPALHLGRPEQVPPGRRLARFPLGDPIARLKQHLIALGLERGRARGTQKELEAEVIAAQKRPSATARCSTATCPQPAEHVRGCLQGHARAPAPAAPGVGSLSMKPWIANARPAGGHHRGHQRP
jgi:2-oxoisovalerate dehydrogenase E1 component alpha subunit